MHKKFIAGIVFAVIIFLGCSTPRATSITSVTENFVVSGRTVKDKSGAIALYWPGSSVKTTFSGTEVKAILKSEHGQNIFNVIIDDDSIYSFKPDSVKKTYTLATALPRKTHTVEIYKVNDFTQGPTLFYGFAHDPASEILVPTSPSRFIEFYGNSITVGAGMLEKHESSLTHLPTNNYLSYGAITARHFEAGYSCISLSGIGLLVSWGSLIMPELYDRIDPNDSTSKWQFRGKHPDIIVVNLLQNDHALFASPDHKQFKLRFGTSAPSAQTVIQSYARFISLLRTRYPKANIICALGCMSAVEPGSPWPGYISSAVNLLNDKKIFTHFFAYKGSQHPGPEEHQEMADSLIEFIDTHIKW